MNANGNRQPSIRDVAAVAGVSYQTVSRVLNRHQHVSEVTRVRVLRVIDSLGYQPSQAAQALATGRTRLIGVLNAPLTNFGPVAALAGIEQAAQAAGYAVTAIGIDETDAESVRSGIGHLRAQAVEGVVVIAAQQLVFDELEQLRLNVPVLTLQGEAWRDGVATAVDQVSGARSATAHLLGLGHTRMAVLAGPEGWLEADARLAGVRTELDTATLQPLRICHGDWTAASGYAAAADLLSVQPTAVLCGNDQMALGLIRAAAERGINVPKQLSVVGFDDVPEAAYYCPPLTTVRQDFARLGELCLETLLNKIEQKDHPPAQFLLPELVVRQSTARLDSVTNQ